MSPVDKNMSNIDYKSNPTRYRIGPAVYQTCPASWKWDCPDATVFNGFLIWMVEGGRATLQLQTGEITLHRGDFLLMPGSPGAFYHGRHSPDRPLEVSWMHLYQTDSTQDTLPGSLLNDIGLHQALTDPEFVINLMRRVVSRPQGEKTLWLEAALREVAREAQTQTANNASPNERLIASLCRQITEDPGRFRTLSDLPPEWNCSRDHLIRLFKKHRGVTPGEFMIEARIERAKQLLRLPGISVKQVSIDLNYPDPYSFIKQFKARTGLPPGRFQTLETGSSNARLTP